jgi:hypothetical protein
MGLKLDFTLSDLKQLFRKHLLLDDYKIVDVVMAVIVANFFQTDPLWLLIIGPSSSAKTEVLNSLDGLPFTYFISDMTTKTLLSGKENASLLPELDNKIVVMKDFTTVLSKRADDLKIIMSQWREIYDGKVSNMYGTGGASSKVVWKGHVGLLGASTPVYDRKHGVVSQMGERFLLYRNTNHKDLESGLRSLSCFGSETSMREELQKAVEKFLNQFQEMELSVPNLSDDLKHKIVALASLCGHGRCHVHRDPYSRDEITYLPEPEGSPRLSKQLYHLGIALMAVNGAEQITDEIFGILLKVGRDLIPRIRFKCIKYLWDRNALTGSGTFLTTNEVGDGIDVNGKTVLRALQDMAIVGLTKSQLDETQRGTPYIWQLTEKTVNLIGWSEFFD